MNLVLGIDNGWYNPKLSVMDPSMSHWCKVSAEDVLGFGLQRCGLNLEDFGVRRTSLIPASRHPRMPRGAASGPR
jgi:hypothetical protein